MTKFRLTIFPNACSGTDPVIENATYNTIIFCGADNSITAGARTSVEPGGRVTFAAPVIQLQGNFQVKSGGSFKAQTVGFPPL